LTRTALFIRWVLGLTTAIFLGLGVAFMFAPGMMIGAIDLKAESPKALADVRAVYGGLDLTIGILLGYCFLRKQWATGLGIGALTCLCLLTGRLVGILVDPARDILTYGLFGSEALGAVLGAVGWFLARQPEPSVASPVETVSPATETAPVAAAEPAQPSTEV